VDAVAAVDYLPLSGGESINLLEVEGHRLDETVFEHRSVTPRYFGVMGIGLLAGRDFTDDDASGRTPVAIVSRGFERRYFPGEGAAGKRILYGDPPKRIWWTIVGVVADVRQFSLETTPPLQFYTPFWQTGARSASVVMRTARLGDRASDMRRLVRELDPTVAVADVRTMKEWGFATTAERRFQTLVLAAFAAIALFLSLVGLYALLVYSVQRRTAEIGIRMALGAKPGSILGLVLKQGLGLAFCGIALGTLCALALTRLMSSLLFGVKPTDVETFLAVAILFAAVSLVACWIPARRATRIDPLIALRYE
jgi:putative ABC transport system permease protein